METNPANKLGKLSLAILENFVESTIGPDAVDTLRGDYQNSQTIAQALERTEDRFIRQYKDKQLSQAMFVDLKQVDRVPLKDALIKYLNHPTDPLFEQSLCAILLGEFKPVISNERIQNAVRFYLDILNEELAILDSSFRDNLVALSILRNNQEKFFSIERAKRVELIIEGEPSDFDSNRQQEVIGVLAALLHIEQSQIRVLHVRAGSIILDLELPEIGINSVGCKNLIQTVSW